MKTRILLFTLILIFVFSCGVFADSDLFYLYDEEDLLSEGEADKLLEELERISGKWGYELSVAVVSDTNGYDASDYIEAWYEEYHYGFGTRNSGVLLMVSMENRQYRIHVHGDAQDEITLRESEAIGEEVASYLSEGEYYGAFLCYARLCEGEFSGEGTKEDSFDFGGTLVIGLGIGFLVALVTVLIFKGQLKSVRSQPHANSYVREGSMNVTRAHEFFLYRTVHRTAKPKNNSSSRSSSSGHTSGGSF